MANYLFLFAFTFLSATASIYAQDGDYVSVVQKERREKDRQFRRGKESPVPAGERRRFKGLAYFAVDTAFRVQATLVRDTAQQPFVMKTTTARRPLYRKYGELHFTLKGQALKLAVYQSLDLMRNPLYHNYLFVPFTDSTTGETTYGAGRYLDLRIPAANTVTLDFNRAYHPYCAYNAEYSCPVTPAENRLPLAVEAGERL
ncbi:MAG: DUF1684 domain-containing protein [Cytophagales bacterium]|jgi:hypothetical protein|nr:DUF1684 domain-containing protein [Cytophagales bacterium]